METKLCKNCNKVLSLTDFYFNHPGKRHIICKSCYKTRASKRYRENPQVYVLKKESIYQYFKTEKGRATWNRASKKGRLLHPEKWNARYLVKRAIAKGIIVKQPCFICGETDVQAHHEDYSKPLEVIFLCRNCHYKRHQIIKQTKTK